MTFVTVEVNVSKCSDSKVHKVAEFVLTILATVAVTGGLTQMLPQGGWIYLINYTVGLVLLTLLAAERVK